VTRADAVLAAAMARLDRALAKEADTQARRNVVEVYRGVILDYHREHNPLLLQSAVWLEAVFARWRSRPDALTFPRPR
jgi:hypothetical protein